MQLFVAICKHQNHILSLTYCKLVTTKLILTLNVKISSRTLIFSFKCVLSCIVEVDPIYHQTMCELVNVIVQSERKQNEC